MKKKWILTLRFESMERGWMRKILEQIVKQVQKRGGRVSGGYVELDETEEAVTDEQP
jgi:hypothetical protein